MLPAAAARSRSICSPRLEWPRRGPRPGAVLLAAARRFLAALPAADERFVSIVGTGQRTVTGIERRKDQFRYEMSAAGDGTVATAAATLAGAEHYCLRCEHSQLPREARVAAAIVELLLHGNTAPRAGRRERAQGPLRSTSPMRSCDGLLGAQDRLACARPGFAAPLSECTERAAGILSPCCAASSPVQVARLSDIGFDDRAELQQLSESYATLAPRAKVSRAFLCRSLNAQ